MTPLALERYEEMKGKTAKLARVTYTDLARSKAWRSQLPEQGIIGIDDRGETPAWLVSDEYLEEMLELVDELLTEREERQIQAMLDARKGYQNWLEGTDLAQQAKASFAARKTQMRAAAHGD